MIAGAELAQWLSDTDRHAQSLTTTNEFTRLLARYPLLLELRRDIEALEVKSAATVQAVAERFLERTEEIGALLDTVIRASAQDPFFRPPLQQSTSEVSAGLALFDEPDLWVAIGITRVDAIATWKLAKAGPASMTFTGFVSILKFIKAGGATLSFWEAPEAGGDFGAERSGRCRFLERRVIEDGEVLVMDGRRQSFVIEHATSDIVHVQAQVRVDAAPLAVEYDSDTLEFVAASSTDEASSRTQMMITLLRMMDHTDAAPLIEKALESPHFYTRWYVMREYLALDAEAALPRLRRMAASDPHPEVRTAAGQVLADFFADEPEQEKIQCRA